MRIAVLITCHNRRATTVGCIQGISEQRLPSYVNLDIYLVDDGCTDGTAKSVAQRFPGVRIIRGDGALFWCGGMRLAWAEAMIFDYDAYLWLNDDTQISALAIATLVESFRSALALGPPGIIVGSACDPSDGRPTYGGIRGEKLIAPGSQMQTCETMNGNIVLIPREVAHAVGNLSSDFRHATADFDYGLRARKAGCMIWVAPGFLGQCRRNPPAAWSDPAVPFLKRWTSLHAPTGQPPRETFIFFSRHYTMRWPVEMLKFYIRVLVPGPWEAFKRLLGRA